MEQICKNCKYCITSPSTGFTLCSKMVMLVSTIPESTCEHFDEKETVKKEDVYL